MVPQATRHGAPEPVDRVGGGGERLDPGAGGPATHPDMDIRADTSMRADPGATVTGPHPERPGLSTGL